MKTEVTEILDQLMKDAREILRTESSLSSYIKDSATKLTKAELVFKNKKTGYKEAYLELAKFKIIAFLQNGGDFKLDGNFIEEVSLKSKEEIEKDLHSLVFGNKNSILKEIVYNLVLLEK